MKSLPAELRTSLLKEVEVFYADYVETTTRRTPTFLSAGYNLLANSCALDDLAEEDFSRAICAQAALNSEEKKVLIQIFKRTLNNDSPFGISARFSPTQNTQKNQINHFMEQFERALDNTFNESIDEAFDPEEAEAVSAPIAMPSTGLSDSNNFF